MAANFSLLKLSEKMLVHFFGEIRALQSLFELNADGFDTKLMFNFTLKLINNN